MKKKVVVLPMLVLIGSIHFGLMDATAAAEPLGWGPFDFSEQWVALVPPPLPSGLSAKHVFDEWGVTISAESVQGPRVGTLSVVPHVSVVTPVIAEVILNGSESESSAGGMAVEFDSPLRRVSLNMGAESQTDAVARFFGRGGSLLGEVTRTLTGIYPEEFALEDAEGAGIARVEVEYEDPTVPEALILIVADFVDPPSFQRCIPQVAHGRSLLGDQTLQTLLTLTPSSLDTDFRIPEPLVIDLSLKFLSPAGTPLDVNLDGEVNSNFDLHIGARDDYLKSRILQTADSISILYQGYACATSRYPFEMAAVYRMLDFQGGVLAEAGIDSVQSGHRFVGVFQKERAEETGTALALANVSDEETSASIVFLMEPSTTIETGVVLGPGEQGAWFVEELAEELAGRDAEGTVEIAGDKPIVATILRTVRGIVSASLPVHKQPSGYGID